MKNKLPTPNPGVLSIKKYVAGRTNAPSGVKTIKLSSNESPLGASPKAIKAYEAASKNLALYPDGSSIELRKALAAKHKINADNIVIGAGSDELLHLLAQIYLSQNDEAIMSEFGFMVYPIITKGAGALIIYAKSKNYKIDVDAILDLVNEKTKIIFLDNPNNPTGTYINTDELARLHAGLRPDILLIIDSAYAEYVDANDYTAGIKLVEKNQNVIMVRTFSKIGLAALRLGWLYAPAHIADALNRFRGPFNVNMAAQKAGIAALNDDEFNQELFENNKKWRTWLTQKLSNNQFKILPSQANFITVLFLDALSAKKADEALLNVGLITRSLASYGLENALRISIGVENAMELLEKTLRENFNEDKNV